MPKFLEMGLTMRFSYLKHLRHVTCFRSKFGDQPSTFQVEDTGGFKLIYALQHL